VQHHCSEEQQHHAPTQLAVGQAVKRGLFFVSFNFLL
jgi:hypothetical protein